MRFVGNDAGRLIEFADLAEQADFVAAGANNLRATVADGAVDEPCTDRVHALDVAQIDGDRVVQRVDFALGGGGAGDGERAGDPVDRAVALIAVLLRDLGHVPWLDARNDLGGQVASA